MHLIDAVQNINELGRRKWPLSMSHFDNIWNSISHFSPKSLLFNICLLATHADNLLGGDIPLTRYDTDSPRCLFMSILSEL